MKSWKTTACGVLAAVSSAINLIAIPLLDADPATNADWVTFGTILATALGLLFARDNKVTSEQAGAGQ